MTEPTDTITSEDRQGPDQLTEAALQKLRPKKDYLEALEQLNTEAELKELLQEYRAGIGALDARRDWLEGRLEEMQKELRTLEHFCSPFLDVEGHIIFKIGKMCVGDK